MIKTLQTIIFNKKKQQNQPTLEPTEQLNYWQKQSWFYYISKDCFATLFTINNIIMHVWVKPSSNNKAIVSVGRIQPLSRWTRCNIPLEDVLETIENMYTSYLEPTIPSTTSTIDHSQYTLKETRTKLAAKFGVKPNDNNKYLFLKE